MAPEKRSRSQWGDDERAAVGAPHRTSRAGVPQITHVADLAAPETIEDEDSAAYDVPERQAYRERKPTPHRIRKLEAFKDDMLERFPRVEANVQYLVDRDKEKQKRANESRKFWRAAGLKAIGGLFSGSVIAGILRALGVL